MKLIGKVSCYQNSVELQNDVNSVVNWCEENKMKVNVDKTKHICFTNKTNYCVSAYQIKNCKITKVYSTKDLGIYFDDKLSFKEQITNITSQARKLIGFIFSQWSELTRTQTFVSLYKVLIRIKLEYAVTTWFPSTKLASNQIEAVQKCFIRLLCNKFRLSYYTQKYEYWCRYFELEPLYLRRKIIDYQFIDELLKSNIQCKILLENIGIQIPSYALRNYDYLTTRDTNKGILYRMIKNYNEIGKELS